MRILVTRLGAIGDSLGVTPLFRYLHARGDEVYILTKETGEQIYRHNPNIDKLILYKDEVEKMLPGEIDYPNNKLGEFFDAVAKAYECDKQINLCESWEVKLARCPHEPNFKYPKNEAMQLCNVNYYEQIFKLANEPIPENLNPEMFFTPEETISMNNMFVDFRKKGKFIILWGLSGSASNKTYPYCPEVIFEILKKYPQVVFLTVGDEACQILEVELKDDRIINKSGIFELRESCLATKYADLVICPDTGILHASGMYDTPKIGLLNHTTIENITMHFKNDFSLEAKDGTHPFWDEISCSPCFMIHQFKSISCQTEEIKGTTAPICMVRGIMPERLIKRIDEVINGK